MSVDLRKYNVYELAFFCKYGSLDDKDIAEIGNQAAINQRIMGYIETRPSSIQSEFRAEMGRLEKEALNPRER